MLPLIAVSVKPKCFCFRSRASVRPAPLGGRDAHLVLERALEGCLRLVASELGESTDRGDPGGLDRRRVDPAS